MKRTISKKAISLCAMIFSCSLIIFLAGCATPPDSSEGKSSSVRIRKQKFSQEKYNKAVLSADYGTVIGMIKTENSDAKNPKLNLSIDEGLAYHFSNAYEQSADLLYETDLVMQQGLSGRTYVPTLFEAYTMIAMDTLNNYNKVGEAYDKEDALEDAMTRIRRIAEIQTMYDEYRKQVDEAAKNEENPKSDTYASLVAASQVFDIDLVKIFESAPPKMLPGDRYNDSEFARLLSVYIRTEYGESSSNFDIKFLKSPEVIQEAKAASSIPSGKGRLEVFALNGTIAQQKVNEVEFPGKDMNGKKLYINYEVPYTHDVFPLSFKFSYPGLERTASGNIKSNSRIDKIKVSVYSSGGELLDQKQTILVEDFNESLRKECEYNANSEFFKNIVAVISAKYTAVTLGSNAIEAAYKLLSNNTSDTMSTILAQMAYETAKETFKSSVNEIDKKIVADTTHVRVLPEKVSCCGFDLPAGNYMVQVDYFSHNSPIHSEKKSATVTSGKPVLFESFCMD